jgi:hypothetical protein
LSDVRNGFRQLKKIDSGNKQDAPS